MNTKFKYIFSTAALLLSVGFTSCTGDLDVKPIDPNLNTKENTSPESAFNKCYANIAMAGNGGANGDSDVDGIDGGTSGYVRQLFNSQELTTDEAICAYLIQVSYILNRRSVVCARAVRDAVLVANSYAIPLHTKSYAFARTCSGCSSNNLISSGLGIVRME